MGNQLTKYTQADRDLLHKVAVIVERLDATIHSDEGAPRCARHSEKLSGLEKTVGNIKKVFFLLGTPLVGALVYHIVK